MKIIVNGVEDTRTYQARTVGDLAEKIMVSGFPKGSVINRLFLNQSEVSLESPETRDRPLSGLDVFEVEISSYAQIVDKNLTNAEEYLKKLIPGIERASVLFRTGSEQEANKFFIQIIDGMDWFSQVMESVLKAIGMSLEEEFYKGKSIRERQEWLLDIIRQMEEVNRNQDWILLADLLEYEIQPYYQEWEKFLPKIREKGLEISD